MLVTGDLAQAAHSVHSCIRGTKPTGAAAKEGGRQRSVQLTPPPPNAVPGPLLPSVRFLAASPGKVRVAAASLKDSARTASSNSQGREGATRFHRGLCTGLAPPCPSGTTRSQRVDLPWILGELSSGREGHL